MDMAQRKTAPRALKWAVASSFAVSLVAVLVLVASTHPAPDVLDAEVSPVSAPQFASSFELKKETCRDQRRCSAVARGNLLWYLHGSFFLALWSSFCTKAFVRSPHPASQALTTREKLVGEDAAACI